MWDYEAYAGAWPEREGPLADRINEVNKYVRVEHLKNRTWTSTTVVQGDLSETYRAG